MHCGLSEARGKQTGKYDIHSLTSFSKDDFICSLEEKNKTKQQITGNNNLKNRIIIQILFE